MLHVMSRAIMCRPFKTLIHVNLRGIYRELYFKDCKVKEIVTKLRFQAGCTEIAKSCGAPRPHATGPSYKEVGGNLMLHQQLKTNLSLYRKVWLLARRMHL